MRTIILLLLASVLLVSCGGKKEIKQVSQESKTATEAFAVADAVREAFIKKDQEAIKKHVSEAGFRDVMAGSRAYDDVALTFTPRWIEIEGGKLLLNISWKSSWRVSGRQMDERGMTVFALEGNPLKLTKILRANPFIPPQ